MVGPIEATITDEVARSAAAWILVASAILDVAALASLALAISRPDAQGLFLGTALACGILSFVGFAVYRRRSTLRMP